jgi:hypothetical protein
MSIDDLCCMWPPLDRDEPGEWTKYGFINHRYLVREAGFIHDEENMALNFVQISRLKATGEIVKQGRGVYSYRLLTADGGVGHFH